MIGSGTRLLVRGVTAQSVENETLIVMTDGHWPYTVKPGDVLIDSNGSIRKVLHAVQGKSG